MPEEALLVLSTFADAATARHAAYKLVEEHLAACANLVPQIESIYRWQGNIESSPEVLVIFKTTHGRYQQLENRLRELHPYEVPEIVMFQIRDGLPAYLNWIVESCR
ncbi:MAG: divalent-cation tolerance protein CutA [Verrucomicrobiota bacterium]